MSCLIYQQNQKCLIKSVLSLAKTTVKPAKRLPTIISNINALTLPNPSKQLIKFYEIINRRMYLITDDKHQSRDLGWSTFCTWEQDSSRCF